MLLLVLNLDNSECFEARLEQLIQALRSTKPLFFGAIQGHEFAVSHESAIGITDWAGIALMTTSGFFLGGGLQKEQKEEGRKEPAKEQGKRCSCKATPLPA